MLPCADMRKNKFSVAEKKKVFWKLQKRYISQKKETTLKWISGVSTEMVLQICSPDKFTRKGSPEKTLQKRFILRVSEELKEAKFRTEALKQKSFLKYSQQVFCTCSLVGNLSEDTRRIFFYLLWPHLLKNYSTIRTERI